MCRPSAVVFTLHKYINICVYQGQLYSLGTNICVYQVTFQMRLRDVTHSIMWPELSARRNIHIYTYIYIYIYADFWYRIMLQMGMYHVTVSSSHHVTVSSSRHESWVPLELIVNRQDQISEIAARKTSWNPTENQQMSPPAHSNE